MNGKIDRMPGSTVSSVVRAVGLGKTYRVYATPWDRVLEAVSRRPRHRDFEALSGVSFELPRGEGLGVVGQNGAGKSTLLKILAGIVAPTAGRTEVRGKVASILELGSGFHPEFTGRQNIRLNAAMLGLGAAEVEEKTPAIIEFSELGEFIDRPVKTYSTGMAMRLGFAIATQVEPDVLIIDEALSVGDGYFQKKCMDQMQEFLADGGTLLFCSHAMYYISSFCRRALWLRHGRPEAMGPAEEVIREYELFLRRKQAGGSEATGPPDEEPAPPAVESKSRRPAGIAEVRVAGRDQGAPGSPLRIEPGDPLELEVEWNTEDPELRFHLGIGVNLVDGTEVTSFSSLHDGLRAWTGASEHRARLVVPELPLVKGEFSIYVFLLDETGLHVHDQKVLPSVLRAHSAGYRFGLVEVAHRWQLEDEMSGLREAASTARSHALRSGT